MLPKRVVINEVGPREGVQIEPAIIATDLKVEMIDMLSECNFPLIQAASFVNPKKVPQMADAELVLQRIRRHEGTQYVVLTLNPDGIRRALALGFEPDPIVLINTSETFSKRNVNRTVAEIIARIPEEIAIWRQFGGAPGTLSASTVWGCNYEGDIPVARVLECVGDALRIAADHDHAFTSLQLGDTTGWATPRTVRTVIGAVRDRWPSMQIRLHLHDTHGLGLANAFAALEFGVDEFDASVGGLGGCPFSGARAHQVAGNIVTEDFVNLCHESGIETGIDYERLLEVAREVEKIFQHALPGKNMHSGSLGDIRRNAAANTAKARQVSI